MHRPAAAKAKVKAAAKAKARAAVRGIRGVRRRPAAPAVGAPPAPERSVVERFEAGEAVDLVKLPLSSFKVGALLVIEEGIYFGGRCQIAGRFRGFKADNGDPHITIQVTGTTNEEALKFVTGSSSRQVDLHLCGEGCRGEPSNQGLVHARQGRVVKMEREAECTWEKNIMEEPVDELAGLRTTQKEMEELRAKEAKEKEEAARKKTKSSSSEGSKKKRKKTKKRIKVKDKEKKKKDAGGVTQVDDEDPRRSYGGRSVAKKSLEAVFGGTGMDPRSRIRRKVLRYARKKVSKKKDASSSSSSTRTSDSGEASSEEGEDALLDNSRLRMLARHAPGSLTAMGIQRMQEALTQQEGVWGLQEGPQSLPAVTLRYVRSVMCNRLSGGALKEAVTTASALDLIVQGRCAEGCDMLMQRLKAVERVSQGSSWLSSEKLELAPTLNPQITTHAEVDQANKEAKQEQKARGGLMVSQNPKGYGKGKKGKSEEKGSNKGKRKNSDAKGNQQSTT